MSINFHANQYEQAFTPHRIQNWEVPKNVEGKFPDKRSGFTKIKANDKGHLLPGVAKERSSPWGSFVGTWDMPNQIPGNRVLNPTSRSEDAVLKGQKLKDSGDIVLSGALKRCHTVDPLPVKMDAPDYQTVGMVCEPAGQKEVCSVGIDPCPQVETTHYNDNQPRAMSRKLSDSLKWPVAKSPCCKSPVGHAQSPKPVTPMAVADTDVQENARQCVSPLAYKNNNAVTGGLKTPDAQLQDMVPKAPSPNDRIVGMKSPTNLPLDGSNPHAEAAVIS